MPTITRAQFKKRFPAALRKARSYYLLSQNQLGDKCGLTGLWISHFERGRRMPSTFHFYQLQQAVKIADWI